MNQTGKTEFADILVVLLAIMALVLANGGWEKFQDYFRSKQSSDKLASLRYHGEWSVGEYRECNSMNLREEDDKPNVVCMESSPLDHSRMFKIKFTGEPTYDSTVVEGTVHYWICRRNNDDVTFSCVKKDVKTEKQSAAESKPPTEHELTFDEIEHLRKRNECEQRFYRKNMYQVNGVSVGEACKSRPDLYP